MDEYHHLRDSAEAAWIADMNLASGRPVVQIICGVGTCDRPATGYARIAGMGWGSVDGAELRSACDEYRDPPTYPAEPVGATALERRVGLPANFAGDRAQASAARIAADVIRRRAWRRECEAIPRGFTAEDVYTGRGDHPLIADLFARSERFAPGYGSRRI